MIALAEPPLIHINFGVACRSAAPLAGAAFALFVLEYGPMLALRWIKAAFARRPIVHFKSWAIVEPNHPR